MVLRTVRLQAEMEVSYGANKLKTGFWAFQHLPPASEKAGPKLTIAQLTPVLVRRTDLRTPSLSTRFTTDGRLCTDFPEF